MEEKHIAVVRKPLLTKKVLSAMKGWNVNPNYQQVAGHRLPKKQYIEHIHL
jgi:hypothetical protein